MKNIIIILLNLFVSITAFSQELDYKLLEKLSEIPISIIDEHMVQGYGFSKLEKSNNEYQKEYYRIYNNNPDKAIVIIVIFPKESINLVQAFVAKDYDIRKIKDELLTLGYDYKGTNELGHNVYAKDKTNFSIKKEPNDAGATQIIVSTDR